MEHADHTPQGVVGPLIRSLTGRRKASRRHLGVRGHVTVACTWAIVMGMTRLRISTGGQVSLPAEIRRRWGTSTVVIEDRGGEVLMRPAPDDPIAAVRGCFADVAMSSDDLRRLTRAEDAAAEERRWRS